MALLRSFAVVGANTLGSRVLGFVRDILIAQALGAGPIADAWVVAFRFPNLFRRLFAEGAFNVAFVPLFVRALEEDGRERARRFAEETLSVLVIGLLLLTALAEIAMPAVIRVIAPGFPRNGEAFALAVTFTQLTFPYLLFMSVVALFGAMLNALGRFALAAAAPMLLNAVLIAAVAFGTRYVPSAGHALAWGVAAAGLVQALALLWGVTRAGFAPRLRVPRMSPQIRRLFVLGVPGVVAGGITQINLLIGTMIATGAAGAPAILYYADRVYQLPLGLIGIAIGVVLLPELARRLRGGDTAGASESLNRALEFSLLLTLPAAAALIVLPHPIANVLFERGAFGPEETRRTAGALMAFGAGLPAFVAIKVLQPGFFAREDTVTPLVFAAISIAANIALSLILFYGAGLGALGIALSTSVAGWLKAILLAVRLRARDPVLFDARLAARGARILLATLVMASALAALQAALWPGDAAGAAARIVALGLLVAGGALVYAAAGLSLGAAQLADLRRALLKA